MQITQFVVDLAAVYYAGMSLIVSPSLTHSLLASNHLSLPSFIIAYHNLFTGQCAGTPTAAISGVALLTSYLFLFVDFYVRTYKSGSKKGSKKPVKAE